MIIYCCCCLFHFLFCIFNTYFWRKRYRENLKKSAYIFGAALIIRLECIDIDTSDLHDFHSAFHCRLHIMCSQSKEECAISLSSGQMQKWRQLLLGPMSNKVFPSPSTFRQVFCLPLKHFYFQIHFSNIYYKDLNMHLRLNE